MLVPRRRPGLVDPPVMAHDAACMAFMEDPSQRLSQIVRAIDGARDEIQNNVTSIFPVLDGKVLDVNVTGTLSGNLSVDHIDSGLVVQVQASGARRGETKLFEDCTQVPSLFGSSDGRKEFSLSGTGGGDGLCLRTITHSTACI